MVPFKRLMALLCALCVPAGAWPTSWESAGFFAPMPGAVMTRQALVPRGVNFWREGRFNESLRTDEAQETPRLRRPPRRLSAAERYEMASSLAARLWWGSLYPGTAEPMALIARYVEGSWRAAFARRPPRSNGERVGAAAADSLFGKFATVFRALKDESRNEHSRLYFGNHQTPVHLDELDTRGRSKFQAERERILRLIFDPFSLTAPIIPFAGVAGLLLSRIHAWSGVIISAPLLVPLYWVIGRLTLRNAAIILGAELGIARARGHALGLPPPDDAKGTGSPLRRASELLAGIPPIPAQIAARLSAFHRAANPMVYLAQTLPEATSEERIQFFRHWIWLADWPALRSQVIGLLAGNRPEESSVGALLAEAISHDEGVRFAVTEILSRSKLTVLDGIITLSEEPNADSRLRAAAVRLALIHAKARAFESSLQHDVRLSDAQRQKDLEDLYSQALKAYRKGSTEYIGWVALWQLEQLKGMALATDRDAAAAVNEIKIKETYDALDIAFNFFKSRSVQIDSPLVRLEALQWIIRLGVSLTQQQILFRKHDYLPAISAPAWVGHLSDFDERRKTLINRYQSQIDWSGAPAAHDRAAQIAYIIDEISAAFQGLDQIERYHGIYADFEKEDRGRLTTLEAISPFLEGLSVLLLNEEVNAGFNTIEWRALSQALSEVAQIRAKLQSLRMPEPVTRIQTLQNVDGRTPAGAACWLIFFLKGATVQTGSLSFYRGLLSRDPSREMEHAFQSAIGLLTDWLGVAEIGVGGVKNTLALRPEAMAHADEIERILRRELATYLHLPAVDPPAEALLPIEQEIHSLFPIEQRGPAHRVTVVLPSLPKEIEEQPWFREEVNEARELAVGVRGGRTTPRAVMDALRAAGRLPLKTQFALFARDDDGEMQLLAPHRAVPEGERLYLIPWIAGGSGHSIRPPAPNPTLRAA